MRIPSQRHLFDVPRGVAYFNCASATPQLNAARERLRESVAEKSHPWTRVPADYFTNAERIRALCAEAIGGDADGYAVVPAASYALATAARTFEPRLAKGDAIVMMAGEFPSLVLAFRRVAAERGASIDVVPAPEDDDWTRAILGRIDARTKVVAVASCHWTNGARVDLVRIARACRDAGAALVVDGTQTVGAMPFDFAAIDPDFLALSGYKWMLGPYGVSFLHVAARWRDARPLEESWLARRGAEDFAALVNPSNEYQPGARRFDMGERSSFVHVPMAQAALTQLLAWGVPEVADTIASLTSYLATGADKIGLETAPEQLRAPHLMGIRFPGGLPSGLAESLAAQRIYVSIRGDSVRVSPHVYNTTADCDRLLDALAKG